MNGLGLFCTKFRTVNRRDPHTGLLTSLDAADRTTLQTVVAAADAAGAVVVLDADYNAWDETLDDAALLH